MKHFSKIINDFPKRLLYLQQEIFFRHEIQVIDNHIVNNFAFLRESAKGHQNGEDFDVYVPGDLCLSVSGHGHQDIVRQQQFHWWKLGF